MLQTLKETIEKAQGSSRRGDGLLGLQQDNAVKMAIIERDVKLVPNDEKDIKTPGRHAAKFWVPSSSGAATSREIHLLPVFEAEQVSTSTNVMQAKSRQRSLNVAMT